MQLHGKETARALGPVMASDPNRYPAPRLGDSCPEGDFEGNQLQGGSMGLSPLVSA